MVPVSLLGVVVGGSSVDAATTTIWSEDFSSCSAPSTSPYDDPAVAVDTPTAKNSGSPIIVDVYVNETLDCPGWTDSGNAWLAVYKSGGAFPGSATRAAWLNEEGPASITRSLTGLTVGRQYRISAEAWTDNYDGNTALGLETSSDTLSMPMVAGTGVQQISISFCAATTSDTLRLFEDGNSYASPVVTNIVLEDMGQSCLQAVADTLTVEVGKTGSLNVVANDAATEGGGLPSGATLAVISGGSAGGTATFSGSTLSYVPLASEVGTTVTVKYLLCPPGESSGEPCSEGTVTITVLASGSGGGSGGGSGEEPEDLSDAGIRADIAAWLGALLIVTGTALSGGFRRLGSGQRST